MVPSFYDSYFSYYYNNTTVLSFVPRHTYYKRALRRVVPCGRYSKGTNQEVGVIVVADFFVLVAVITFLF